MDRIGFLGLGTMGLPMAINLAKAGLRPMVFNRTRSKVGPVLKVGAMEATSIDALFDNADTVVMMLSGPEAIEGVLVPIIENPACLKGKGVVNMGTNPPSFSRQMADRLESLGAVYVDAPVSGTKVQAEEGTLLIMTSGPEGIDQTLSSLFNAVGKTVVHCGPVPNAGMMKLAVNIVLSASLSGLMEGAHFAEKGGLDLKTFFQLILGGPLGNDMFAIKAKKIMEKDFTPQASIGTVAEMLKHIMDTAYDTGAFIPNTAFNMNLIRTAQNMGLSHEDACAILKVFSRGERSRQEEETRAF